MQYFVIAQDQKGQTVSVTGFPESREAIEYLTTMAGGHLVLIYAEASSQEDLFAMYPTYRPKATKTIRFETPISDTDLLYIEELKGYDESGDPFWAPLSDR